jgi:hypothetical protein
MRFGNLEGDCVFKLYGRFLMVGWVLLALFVAIGFHFPKEMSRIIGWSAHYFVLIPLFLFLGSAVYLMLVIFRAGTKRT